MQPFQLCVLPEQGWIVALCVELDWSGVEWFGLVWIGLRCNGLGGSQSGRRACIGEDEHDQEDIAALVRVNLIAGRYSGFRNPPLYLVKNKLPKASPEGLPHEMALMATGW
eukprot:6417071-Pyramimonas_sp.AAC.2